MVPKVKICCISSLEEANTAINMGAYALGLVSQMPSGPGVIKDDEIKHIAGNLPHHILSFLLTCKTDARSIAVQQKHAGTNTIQLVDEIPLEEYARLRETLPGVRLVQVIHVLDEFSIEQALKISSYADALLLDSGNPLLKIKELGGTGRTHDWLLSRKIRESVSIPVYLAGGLKPENVREAVQTVEPFAVDLCSGVRTAGRLDPVKLEKFFNEINHL
jgi:phosphoribosylanthranilate isomerase